LKSKQAHSQKITKCYNYNNRIIWPARFGKLSILNKKKNRLNQEAV
jgi:hypothetical protein